MQVNFIERNLLAQNMADDNYYLSKAVDIFLNELGGQQEFEEVLQNNAAASGETVREGKQEYEVIDPNLFKKAPYHDKSSSINCQSTSQDEQKEYQYDELNLTADDLVTEHDSLNESNLDEAAVETQNEENWINETNQVEPRAKKPRTVLNQLQLKIIQKIKPNVNVFRREEAAEVYFICDGCNKTFQHKTSLTRHKKSSCPSAHEFDIFKTEMFVKQEYEVIDPNLLRRESYDGKSGSINYQSTSQNEQKKIQYDELSMTGDEEAAEHDLQSESNSEVATAETQIKENSINESNQAELTAKKSRTELNQPAEVSRREEAAEVYFICDGCNKTFQHKTSLTRHKKSSCPSAHEFDIFKTEMFVKQEYEVIDPNLLRRESYDGKSGSINYQSTSQNEQKKIQYDELSMTGDEEAAEHDLQSESNSEVATAETQIEENSINESNQAEQTAKKSRTELNQPAEVSRREEETETDVIRDTCDEDFLQKTSLTRHNSRSMDYQATSQDDQKEIQCDELSSTTAEEVANRDPQREFNPEEATAETQNEENSIKESNQIESRAKKSRTELNKPAEVSRREKAAETDVIQNHKTSLTRRKIRSMDCQTASQDEQKEIQCDEPSSTKAEKVTEHDPQNESSSDKAAAETQNEENSIKESNQIEPGAKKPRTVLNQLQLKIIQKCEIKPNVHVPRREEAAKTQFTCDNRDRPYKHNEPLRTYLRSSKNRRTASQDEQKEIQCDEPSSTTAAEVANHDPQRESNPEEATAETQNEENSIKESNQAEPTAKKSRTELNKPAEFSRREKAAEAYFICDRCKKAMQHKSSLLWSGPNGSGATAEGGGGGWSVYTPAVSEDERLVCPACPARRGYSGNSKIENLLPPRRQRNVPPRPVDRTTEAKRLQRLYRLNKKRAAQQILAGPNRTCEVNIANTERFFTKLAAHRVGGEEWPNVFDRPGPTPESTEHLCRPIEIGEVYACLGRRANSSPGPDGDTYADLKRADPGSRKGDPGDISNWRPISLADTVPKLFAAVLTNRVKEWAVTNAVYSKSQKGFLQFEGCFEHNVILQEILREAKDRKREVVVAWLDLSNAFPSLPHSSIFRALEGHGMPLKVRNVISSLYADMRTRIQVASGSTNPIRICSGVRQGCPLSPDVFNLTLEVVL
uniref:Reverse transcriptase domain-containing protein n=1 Tax=Trichogramma kaykai TaxID=54128 RepID=A0ABD2XJP6_9HYME